MKRFLNIVIALVSILLLSPLMLIVSLVLLFESGAAPIYSSIRVGKN